MEPKKPRSKTLVLVIVVLLVLLGFGLYYAMVLANSDNRPKSVETESVIRVVGR